MRIKSILILLILQKSRVFDIFSFSNQISCSILKFFTICELYIIKFLGSLLLHKKSITFEKYKLKAIIY